jgi:hypothetical protein
MIYGFETTHPELIESVKKDLFEDSAKVDPNDEHDWTSLVYGLETAESFAYFITGKKQFEWLEAV